MGLLRGGIIIIAAIAIFVAVLGTNLFLTLNLSSSYENVEPMLKEVTNTWATESGAKSFIVNNHNLIQNHCQKNEIYPFNFKELSIEIPCETVDLGAKKTLDYILDSLPNYFYYKQYNCEFTTCLEQNENSLIILSNTGKNYWKTNFYYALIISLILISLIFVVAKEKRNTFYISGILIILATYPFKKINWLFSIAPDFVPLSYLPTIFSKSNFVYQTMLIIGIVVFTTGFLIGIVSGIKKGVSFIKWVKNKFKKKDKISPEKKPKESIKELEKNIEEKLKLEKKSKKKKF